VFILFVLLIEAVFGFIFLISLKILIFYACFISINISIEAVVIVIAWQLD